MAERNIGNIIVELDAGCVAPVPPTTTAAIYFRHRVDDSRQFLPCAPARRCVRLSRCRIRRQQRWATNRKHFVRADSLAMKTSISSAAKAQRRLSVDSNVEQSIVGDDADSNARLQLG